jgi:hypothetical protein
MLHDASMTRYLAAATVLAGVCLLGQAFAYDWETVPKTVNDLEQNLTVDFQDRTALLWGTREGVVGGTGAAILVPAALRGTRGQPARRCTTTWHLQMCACHCPEPTGS